MVSIYSRYFRAGDPMDRQKVEVARSFAYKLNIGNYQSQDFFCAQKAECEAWQAEETSQRLYAFCKSQVMKAVREVQQQMEADSLELRKQAEEVNKLRGDVLAGRKAR